MPVGRVRARDPRCTPSVTSRRGSANPSRVVATEAHSRSILVLGPHRSGTSAVARVLNLLGVDLGGEMMPPKFDNRHGYWEHQRIFDLHERLLSRTGSAWHDYRPMPVGWRDLEEVEAIRGELVAFLRTEFGTNPLWGVKDPRLCRLVPWWLDALEELGATPLFVVVVRHPLEVARSLERRDHFSPSKCILLYAAEMLAAVQHTQGRRRAFVSYARLLDDWRGAVTDLARQLRLEWPRDPVAAGDEIDAFLQPGERHHRHDLDELRADPLLAGWCAELYEALEGASSGRDADLDGAFPRARDSFRSAMALFLPELEDLEKERTRLERRTDRAESELALVQRQLTSILSSRFYRSTRRIRHGWHRLARFRR